MISKSSPAQGELFHQTMHGNLVPKTNSWPSVDSVVNLPYESQREAAATIKRLSRQCRTILTRLERGPASNRDLAAIALNYRARVSDLRAAGHAIECYDQDRATGLSWYRLRTPTAREGPDF